MAETVIRKACDRCHAQKLSCKRYNDEPCERCVRLKTECKSSPSLRYRKNQQQQQLVENSNNNNTSQPALNSASSTERRSPKRRRTDIQEDASLVSPETVPHTTSLTSKSHVPVSPDPVDNSSSSAADFAFTFDQQLAFFTNNPQYLSHPEFPIDNHHHPPVFWEQPATTTTTPTLLQPEVPVVVPPYHHHQVAPEGDALKVPVPLTSAGESCVPEHSISSDKRASRPRRTTATKQRPRTRLRPRQITLRHDADLLPLQQPEAPRIHWMAQLSDINARLLDLASALPSPQDGPFLGRPVDEGFRGQGFPIEDMFKLTRRVADILEEPPSSNESNKMHHSTIDGSDPGNAMFILSTYVRLLDMYQRVFNLVHTELISPPDANTMFSFWELPDVTVGSFAVESSPFLQMSLTIQLAEEFLSRLRGSTARWLGAGTASSMFSGVVDVSFQAFRDREEALAKHLVELRSEIEPWIDS
ncbi:unnamed protein product [Fusarium venenatum]|uniref:Zn(2)-C6 fungal-type domain-containing protein n=1 Tax=Fusarium venenatum TaxID=56646 RepID=A0A2L2T5W7_9HYPO|nr:uncharacterized protein FVRRES_07569 [Fusarium venenatum]CEI63133.1 unnamed protein product [Fusarium venenatum]